MPKSFEGFTILQITDLHGKYFGENQEKLIDIINNNDYDMIAITGDVINKHTESIEPFLDLMNGISNKENVFFVFGNADDKKYYNDIKSSGCNMLEEPYKFERDNDELWINEYNFQQRFDKDGVSIGLGHIPIPQDVGYDLILVGHYHGGQYRIPFYGALFVPDVNGNGILPKQEDVSGIKDFGNYKQYISRGLGASANLKFLEFRLFNTPEINLIKLVR